MGPPPSKKDKNRNLMMVPKSLNRHRKRVSLICFAVGSIFWLALWRQDMKPSLSSAGRVSSTLPALQKVHVDRWWSIIQQRVLHELSGAASRLPLLNHGSWKITLQGNQHLSRSQPPLFKMMIFLLLRWDMDDRSRKMVPYASLLQTKLLFVVVIVNCHHRSAGTAVNSTVLKGSAVSAVGHSPGPIMSRPNGMTQQGLMPGPHNSHRWVKFAVGPLRWETGQLPQAVLDHQHGICWRSWRRSRSKIADVVQVLWRNAILTI